MNNYPSWWNTTVTLYNKYEDPLTQVVTWYKTVITGCFWKDVHDKVKIGEVLLEGDSIVCRLRKNDKFVDADTWLALPADKKATHFTLGYQDIIIKGEVSDTINEYNSQLGMKATELMDKYKKLQRCLEIDKFADNTGGGRGNEHYFVSGV